MAGCRRGRSDHAGTNRAAWARLPALRIRAREAARLRVVVLRTFRAGALACVADTDGISCRAEGLLPLGWRWNEGRPGRALCTAKTAFSCPGRSFRANRCVKIGVLFRWALPGVR